MTNETNELTCVLCGGKVTITGMASYRGIIITKHDYLETCADVLRRRVHPLEFNDDLSVAHRALKVGRALFHLPSTAVREYKDDGYLWAATIVTLREEIEEIEEMVQKAANRKTADYTPDAYQQQALRTWAGGKDKRDEVQHAALGLGGEVGEFLDLIKKSCYKPGYILSPEKAKDELADVVYYVLVMAHLWGFTFQDMMDHLAVKLDDGHGWVAK